MPVGVGLQILERPLDAFPALLPEKAEHRVQRGQQSSEVLDQLPGSCFRQIGGAFHHRHATRQPADGVAVLRQSLLKELFRERGSPDKTADETYDKNMFFHGPFPPFSAV